MHMLGDDVPEVDDDLEKRMDEQWKEAMEKADVVVTMADSLGDFGELREGYQLSSIRTPR